MQIYDYKPTLQAHALGQTDGAPKNFARGLSKAVAYLQGRASPVVRIFWPTTRHALCVRHTKHALLWPKRICHKHTINTGNTEGIYIYAELQDAVNGLYLQVQLTLGYNIILAAVSEAPSSKTRCRVRDNHDSTKHNGGLSPGRGVHTGARPISDEVPCILVRPGRELV